jgi:hypothetical protein
MLQSQSSRELDLWQTRHDTRNNSLGREEDSKLPSRQHRVRQREIEAAQGGEGPTVVDIITDIIRIHGPGGAEEEDGIELELA